MHLSGLLGDLEVGTTFILQNSQAALLIVRVDLEEIQVDCTIKGMKKICK